MAAVSKATVGASHMLINGSWVDSVSGMEIPVESPGNRQIIASIPRGGAEDVDRAVKAASEAFPGWSRTIPRERGRMLRKIADAVEARAEELARIVAEETGNAIRTLRRQSHEPPVRSIHNVTTMTTMKEEAEDRAGPGYYSRPRFG